MPQTGCDELVDHDGCESRTCDPVGCVGTHWSGRVEGDDYELIGNVNGTTVGDVCISEAEGPVMWECSDGVVLPQTGSDDPFGDHGERDAFKLIGKILGTYLNGVCLSEPDDPDVGRCVSSIVSPRTMSDVSMHDIVCVLRTGEPVGCVSTGLSGGVYCYDYEGTVALVWTGSDESVTGGFCLTRPDGPVDGVSAGGTGTEGCNVYVRDISRSMCEGCCPVDNVASVPQTGEPCEPDEPVVLARLLNRPSLSLWLFVSIGSASAACFRSNG